MKAKNGVLLIEEPENHLHPGYLRVLLDTIFGYSKALDVQIFMSTHSCDLLQDALDVATRKNIEKDVQVTKLIKEGDAVRGVDYSVKQAKNVTKNLNFDLRGL